MAALVMVAVGVGANADKSPRRNWASSGATKAVEVHSYSARFQQMCLSVAAGHIQRLFLEQSTKVTIQGAELHSNLEALASLGGTETISKLSPAGPMCFYLQTQSHLSLTDS